MAFDFIAVPIRISNGEYQPLGKRRIFDGVDLAALRAAYPLIDITEERDGLRSGYVDEATLIPIHRFRKFITSDEVSDWLSSPAMKWATVILLHRSEW